MSHPRFRLTASLALLAVGSLPGADGGVTFHVVSNMSKQYNTPWGITEGSTPGTFIFHGGSFQPPPSVLLVTSQGVQTVLATVPSGALILHPLVSAANGRFYSALSETGTGPQTYIFSVDETAGVLTPLELRRKSM